MILVSLPSASFAAMGQLAETEVWRAGEATARGNLLKGEDNFAVFRGKSVYEVRSGATVARTDPCLRLSPTSSTLTVVWSTHSTGRG